MRAAPAVAATEAQTLDIAAPFIAREEGKRNVAYRDIVGIWTICYGSTRGVHAGMVATYQQCLALLRAEVAEFQISTATWANDRHHGHRDAIGMWVERRKDE